VYEALGDARGRVQYVFAVVEDREQATLAEPVDELRLEASAAALLQADAVRDC
jgi:hypothetical protein